MALRPVQACHDDQMQWSVAAWTARTGLAAFGVNSDSAEERLSVGARGRPRFSKYCPSTGQWLARGGQVTRPVPALPFKPCEQR